MSARSAKDLKEAAERRIRRTPTHLKATEEKPLFTGRFFVANSLSFLSFS